MWSAVSFAIALLAAAEGPLFPLPLHLVRRVEDPIANKSAEIDEYCSGNRIITVDGYKTVIVDYERQEMREIDRARSEYSVARFDEIAAANAATRPPAARDRWSTTPLGVKASAGRSADAFEIAVSGPEAIKIEVKIDRELSLSRKAFDALAGAAYPNELTPQHEALARAAMRERAVAAVAETAGSYGIPLEQTITFDVDAHTHLTIRNAIVSITNDLPPPEALASPAGA